jgi:DNA modification methylase
MDIRKINIDKLRPAQYNPRVNLQKGDEVYSKLERSIERFGCVEPIVWNESTGNVVGGHQRLKILIDKGVTETEVSVVNLSLEDEKALNLALNKITGDWDNEKLAALLEELKLTNIDMSVTGFDDKDIENIISEFKEFEIIEDDFDIDNAVPENPITQLGDIWTLGRHKLMCGDSTLADTYKHLLGSETVQLVVTDPPYNVDYEGEAGKIQNDNMSAEAFYNFIHKAYRNMYEVMQAGAGIYIFHAETEAYNFIKAFRETGFHHSSTCVWVKQSFIVGRSDYQWQHEPILYGWKEGAPHKWYSDRSQSTVWEYDRPTKSELHPTMKPVQLCAYPIINSSKEGDIVLDAFGGSGSTLIACEQTGRICRMIEIDEKFCDVIVKRYKQSFPDSIIKRNGKKENIKI